MQHLLSLAVAEVRSNQAATAVSVQRVFVRLRRLETVSDGTARFCAGGGTAAETGAQHRGRACRRRRRQHRVRRSRCGPRRRHRSQSATAQSAVVRAAIGRPSAAAPQLSDHVRCSAAPRGCGGGSAHSSQWQQVRLLSGSQYPLQQLLHANGRRRGQCSWQASLEPSSSCSSLSGRGEETIRSRFTRVARTDSSDEKGLCQHPAQDGATSRGALFITTGAADSEIRTDKHHWPWLADGARTAYRRWSAARRASLAARPRAWRRRRRRPAARRCSTTRGASGRAAGRGTRSRTDRRVAVLHKQRSLMHFSTCMLPPFFGLDRVNECSIFEPQLVICPVGACSFSCMNG